MYFEIEEDALSYITQQASECHLTNKQILDRLINTGAAAIEAEQHALLLPRNIIPALIDSYLT